jgi:mRNA interferase RelE/StbE
LAKIDRVKARKIENKVENFLARDPYKNGEPLKGSLKGRWKYRFSKYRVIYEVKEKELIILVVEVGHRKEIY